MIKKEYREIVNILPERLKRAVENVLTNNIKFNELRIRAGKPIVLVSATKSYFIDKDNTALSNYGEGALKAGEEDISEIFNRLSHYSVYTYSESLKNTYITLSGGGRVGVSSSAVVKNGEIVSVKDISGYNFRVPRELKCISDEVLKVIYNSELCSSIIVGPPSSGKTTVLRDICRSVSSGYNGKYLKCCIIDERNEIAAVQNGKTVLDVGINTDVLTFFPKAYGTLCALRTLSPEIIFLDEIGTIEEAKSIAEGLNSGVKFVVSAHADSIDEALLRPQLNAVLSTGSFKYIVLLGKGENLGCLCAVKKL